MTYLELSNLRPGTVVQAAASVGMVVQVHTGEYATNKVDRYIVWAEGGGRTENLETLHGDQLDDESEIKLVSSEGESICVLPDEQEFWDKVMLDTVGSLTAAAADTAAVDETTVRFIVTVAGHIADRAVMRRRHDSRADARPDSRLANCVCVGSNWTEETSVDTMFEDCVAGITQAHAQSRWTGTVAIPASKYGLVNTRLRAPGNEHVSVLQYLRSNCPGKPDFVVIPDAPLAAVQDAAVR